MTDSVLASSENGEDTHTASKALSTTDVIPDTFNQDMLTPSTVPQSG